MKSLREHIAEAQDRKIALGHFNISNIEGFWAVVNASKKLNLPVVIGVSEGERDFIGIRQVKALVDTVRYEGLPVFLNADHTYSFERIKEIVDADFDSVIIDGAETTFEENLKVTRESVEYARGKSQNILVEGELGFIGKSSKILDELPAGAEVTTENLTKPDEARDFVEKTGVDLFAPAVGNIHGLIKSGNPKINAERIKEISDAVGVPLVLHGGSGITDEEFLAAIDAGIRIIHINTEIRLAYKQAMVKSFSEMQDEIAPYKLLKPAIQAMQAVIERRLALFSKIQT
jgi:fructose-bisphosphate aldolase class II